jgi:hypothetical protein
MRDPTTLAWIIVAAYAGGALLALAAGGSAVSARERRFWKLAAAVLFLLGLNKQLDLQLLLTDAARSLAKANGWYELRRIVQGAFLLILGLGAVAAGILFARWLRGTVLAVKIAAAGLLLLTGFVLARAAAFHHIDAWVMVNVAGLRSGWWLELAGIALIGAGAAARLRSRIGEGAMEA